MSPSSYGRALHSYGRALRSYKAMDRTKTYVDANVLETDTLPWDYYDYGTTTPSAFLDIFGLKESASIEFRDIPTEISPLLNASHSFLDTDDTSSLLEPYLSAGAGLSSNRIDEPISHGELIYKNSWDLSSLPQTQDLEKVVVDARSDSQAFDILGLSQSIGNLLETNPQGHFSPRNDRNSTIGFDDRSLDVLEPMSVSDGP